MEGLFTNFLSNKALFFDLFDKAAKNVVEMAALQLSFINSPKWNEHEATNKQLDKMEHAGDAITRKIYLCLDKIIFTPLNRDDIHALAATIHDVADTVKEASNRMFLYNINEFTPAIKEIANIILMASLEIEKAVNSLRTQKKPDELHEICREIKNHERLADRHYYTAVAELFATEKDAVKLIKYREILLSLETAVNKCKCVADALNVISVNNR